jgi:hypothetical protein
MSHKYERLLQGILQEPVSGNIHWREVESLLHHLGATISAAHGARVHVVLNNVEGHLHRPHHSGICTKQEVRHVREFLLSSGITLAGIAEG